MQDKEGMPAHVPSVRGHTLSSSSDRTGDFMRTSNAYYTEVSRGIQFLRTKILHRSRLNYDHKITMSPEGRHRPDLVGGQPECSHISPCSATSDLPESGDGCILPRLGALCQESSQRTGGSWSRVEATPHINWLELRAASLAVRCFASQTFTSSISWTAGWR